MKKKILLVGAMMVLVALAAVGVTMAYLTSTDKATNTFTVGNVAITLDEAKVDDNGQAITGEGAERVKENSYKLMPGLTYDKDPMVTVTSTDDCYVRMFVAVSDMTKLKAAFPDKKYYANEDTANGVFLLEKLITGWNSSYWKASGYNGGVYEFRHNNAVGAGKMDELFTKVVIPGDVTNDQLANLNQVKIKIVAQAIQADGFIDASDAFSKAPAVTVDFN